MPGNYVFRRPWREWRRGKPKTTFVLPPPPPSPQTPDYTALGFRRAIPTVGDKRYVFRRPWGAWGGYRGKYVVIRNTGIVLSASTGTFLLTGYAATFQTQFVATEASYALTGNAAALQQGLTAAYGPYALGGQALAFQTQFVATQTSFSFSFTGYASTGVTPFSVSCGLFALTGSTANVVTTMKFWTLEAGSVETWTPEADAVRAWSAETVPDSTWTPEGDDGSAWTVQTVPDKTWSH